MTASVASFPVSYPSSVPSRPCVAVLVLETFFQMEYRDDYAKCQSLVAAEAVVVVAIVIHASFPVCFHPECFEAAPVFATAILASYPISNPSVVPCPLLAAAVVVVAAAAGGCYP